MEKVLLAGMVAIDVIIPYGRGDLVALVHEKGVIQHKEHGPEGTRIKGRVPAEIAARLD